jgi:outer membrane receptor protein involved in Fe transport
VHPVVNLRLAASRTVSRPDLNELSPSPALEYVGGFRIAGNPELERATIENYDVRVEAFPSLSEVVAAGFFYKSLDEPIEQVIQGGSPMLLVPRNSDYGFNRGIELEANSRLGRFSKRLESFSLNTNATFISSEVVLKEQVSKLGSQVHPLQGQATYLLNAALTYSSSKRRTDASILFGVTGERLATVAVGDLGDIYEQPSATLDATFGLGVGRGRLKLSARNLLDPEILQLQLDKVVSSFRRGRSYSIGFTYPS